MSAIVTKLRSSFALDLQSQSSRSKNLLDMEQSLMSTGSTSSFSNAQILMEFKNNVHSDPLNSLAYLDFGNNSKNLFHNWTGVYCTQNRVVGLDVANMQLQGTITPFSGKLNLPLHAQPLFQQLCRIHTVHAR